MLLHRAVQESNISEVKKLLKQGIDVNAKDKRGNTVLHFVQDKDIASLLLSSSSDPNIQNDNGDTPVHMWCMPALGCLRDLKETISLKQQILALFLEAGASPNIQNHFGYSGLHTVFVYGGIAGLGLDTDNIRDIVTLFIKFNANVNLADFEGCTPLHHAVREPNMTSSIELLLRAEASVNAKDRRGMTPLHFLFDLDDKEMVELLLRHGCNVNEQDINGSTMLSCAVLVGNEVMVERLLSDPQTSINLGDWNGITPLHLAAAYKRIGICEMLVAYAADVDARDVWNATPLHYAAYGGTPEIVSLLLQGASNHELRDNLNNLPIQYALDRHYFHTAIAFGEAYLQDIKAHLTTTANQVHRTTDLEDHILQSFPADDVLTTIVPASRVYSNPFNTDILPPDTMDYIKLITNGNSSTYVRTMTEVPGIGRIPDNEEASEIRLAVESYIQKLTAKIAEVDPRFRGSLLCSGSVYEGTKICDPYEFDYMLCLETFEQMCTVQLDENTRFDNVQVSKLTNFVDTSFDDFFHENKLQSDKIMEKFVEVSRKAMSRLNYTTGSNNLYLQSLT
jgi:ankyrin repeat protein